MSDDLVGAYDVRRVSLRRLMTIDGLDAVSPGHRTLGLIELDVSLASARIEAIQARGGRVSLFAFVVACIARALSEHRDLNAVRAGRKIFRFEDVDISVAVEVDTPEGPYPYQLSLRRAHTKTPLEIYAEIEAARTRHAATGSLGRESHRFEGAMRLLAWMPRSLRLALLRLPTRSPLAVKRFAGTTFVTSVGKFASAPGFVIPFAAGPMAASFALGSVTLRPVLRGQEVRNHPFLSLTIIVNHDLVDGGPAARFASRLQALVEGAAGLDEVPAPDAATA